MLEGVSLSFLSYTLRSYHLSKESHSEVLGFFGGFEGRCINNVEREFFIKGNTNYDY